MQIKNNNINKLKPFINNKMQELNTRPASFHINEADNFYIASNGIIAGLLFKKSNIDKDINYTFCNDMSNIIKVWKECRKQNEYYIIINRKDILDGIKQQWKQLKFSAKSCKINLKKEDVLIVLSKDKNNYTLKYLLQTKYNIQELNDKLYSDFYTQEIDTDYKDNIEYRFNLKYFETVLNFFSNTHITAKINGKYNPWIFEQEDRESLICPLI